MHGRKKGLKGRNEEEIAFTTEYWHLYSKIKPLIENKQYDEESLKTSKIILLMNVEYYSLWNFRRNIILHLSLSWSEEEKQKRLEEELTFNVECIKKGTKSYWVWHHRTWILNLIPFPNYKNELFLCSKMLDLDSRNFHCWDYRRKVCSKIKDLSINEEIDFTFKKISQNFSNYSAWHLRSKLFPLQFSNKTITKFSNSSSQLYSKEFELVRNAVFTEPADQSPWLYHRWLLGKSQQKLDVCGAYNIGSKYNKFIVLFSDPVKVTKDSLMVELNNKEIEGKWIPSHSIIDYFCNIWIFHPNNLLLSLEEEEHLKVRINMSKLIEKSNDASENENENENENEKKTRKDEETLQLSFINIEKEKENHLLPFEELQNRNELASEFVRSELKSVSELVELEPNSKWPLLTSAFLYESIGEYDNSIEIVENLIQIDPLRQNFYQDQRSNLIMKKVAKTLIKERGGNLVLDYRVKEIDLSGRNLSVLSQTEILSLIKFVNLSKNNLINTKGIYLLHSAEQVNLEENNITEVEGIDKLKFLKKLSLRKNNIKTFGRGFESESIEDLDLRDNPIQINQQTDYLKKRFPNLKVFNGSSLS